MLYNKIIFLKSDDQKKLTTGIQLFGLVLANNIEHYEFQNETSPFDLYSALINTMRNPSKLVHAPGAEVVGMLMKNVNTLCKEDKDVCVAVEAVLLQTLKELDISLYITNVHRIQLNFPAIVDTQKSILVYHLPKLCGEFRLMCAESILARADLLEDHFFAASSFTDMIERRESSSLQLVCLRMIYEHFLSKQKKLHEDPSLLDQIESEMMRMFSSLCDEFVKHSSVACRYQLMLILILAFDIQDSRKDMSSVNAISVRKLTNETLLKALLDEGNFRFFKCNQIRCLFPPL